VLNGLEAKIIDDLFDQHFLNLSMLIVTEANEFNKKVKEKYTTKNPLLFPTKPLIDRIKKEVKLVMRDQLKVKLSLERSHIGRAMNYLDELKQSSQEDAG
jgi:hypothetical protein